MATTKSTTTKAPAKSAAPTKKEDDIPADEEGVEKRILDEPGERPTVADEETETRVVHSRNDVDNISFGPMPDKALPLNLSIDSMRLFTPDELSGKDRDPETDDDADIEAYALVFVDDLGWGRVKLSDL